MTDADRLASIWGVTQEEATKRALHLTRDLMDHELMGGQIFLWSKSFKVERIRFTFMGEKLGPEHES